jgi:hypothetical protein
MDDENHIIEKKPLQDRSIRQVRMDNNKKRKENGKPTSGFDKAKKIVSDFVEQLKGREFRALIKQYDVEYGAATPADGLTDEDLQEMSEDSKFQRNCEYVRKVLNDFMEGAGNCSNAELVKVSSKGLDLLIQIEKGNYSLYRELGNTFNTVIELCRIENKGRQASGKAWDEITTKRNWLSNFLWKLYEKTLGVIIEKAFEKYGPRA